MVPIERAVQGVISLPDKGWRFPVVARSLRRGLSRPFRAFSTGSPGSQGVALGLIVAAPSGRDASRVAPSATVQAG